MSSWECSDFNQIVVTACDKYSLRFGLIRPVHRTSSVPPPFTTCSLRTKQACVGAMLRGLGHWASCSGFSRHSLSPGSWLLAQLHPLTMALFGLRVLQTPFRSPCS